MTISYTLPVSKLLLLGEQIAQQDPWPDYLAMGFTPADIPELIRLVSDFETVSLPLDENGKFPDAVFAQIHAWRTLAQLRAVDAIPHLLHFFYHVDELGRDCISSEIPLALGMLGRPAIQPCAEFLMDAPVKDVDRGLAGLALVNIALAHPETCAECIAILTAALEKYEEQDDELNSDLILCLADVGATEVWPLVEKVYQSGRVAMNILTEDGDFLAGVGMVKKNRGIGKWFMPFLNLLIIVVLVVIIISLILDMVPFS